MISHFDTLFRAVINSTRFKKIMDGTQIRLSDGRTLDVKISELKVVKRPVGLRFSKFIFEAKATSGDIIENGTGESDHLMVAVQKSVAEALERLIFRVLKNSGTGTHTTNGWSCHTSLHDAKTKSFTELAERDAVLVHWLRKEPMVEIAPSTFPKKLQAWVADELTLHPTLKNLIVLMTTSGVLPTIVTILRSEAGQAVISHSAGLNLSSAVTAALSETCRLATNLESLHFYESSKKLANGETDSVTAAQDQGMLYSYHLRLPEWLIGSQNSWRDAEKKWATINENDVLKKIHFKFHAIISQPLCVGYGESKDLQDLYFGSTQKAVSDGKINFLRLNRSGVDGINLLPHFIS